MNKKDLKDKDKVVIVGFACVLIVIATYLIAFQSLYKKASEVSLQNDQLRITLADLQQKDINKQKVIDNTEECEGKIKKISMKFPDKVTFEGMIYDLNSILQELGSTKANSIEVLENIAFYPLESADGSAETNNTSSSTGEVSETGTTSDQEDPNKSNGSVTAFRSKMTITLSSMSYSALRELIKETQKHKNRLVIDSVNATYDKETGLLGGTFELSFYALDGSPNKYEAPDLSGIQTGLKNLFGTFED